MGLLPWGKFSDVFNEELEQALDKWDPGDKNGYATGRWEKIRGARVPKGLVHAGELALDAVAIDLVHDEATPAPIIPALVYPHPAGSGSHSGGFIHVTGGLPGNIALDFMAPGGTALLATFAGKITKLSGRNPREGVHGGDRFGWSIYLTRADGLFAFMTHEGTRDVALGEHVSIGQKIGSVGRWPNDPGRSHTHLGITSPKGISDATHVLLQIAAAPKLPSV